MKCKDEVFAAVVTILMGILGLNIFGVIGGVEIAGAGAIVFSISSMGGFVIYHIKHLSGNKQ